uniref:Uncharacterized protein n=1 Tax=Asparagus officinalis TaxID=4686 RepID=Q2AA74_ASPOF|nr:hypothetical protein 18.t00016 [Asparagus officinalis]
MPYMAGGGERAGGSRNLGVAEGAGLDEWAEEEETVGEADLDATEEGGDGGAVGGEVGELPRDEGGGGDGCFQAADEGVAVYGLDHWERSLL